MNMVYKSKIKVKYESALGLYILIGSSLTRRTLHCCTFYNKSAANTFKERLDTEDFHFYHNNINNKKYK